MPPDSTDLRPVARALLSVSDKTGLVALAQGLAAHGVSLVSTGGTHKALTEAGLAVEEVADLTGFPEMMDGRVKTLHPKVHGGLLAIRGNPEHEAAMLAHDVKPIDLLVVNLYPFEATVARGADFSACVENIDVGGPAMIRGAAKNHVPMSPSSSTPTIIRRSSPLWRPGGTDLTLRKKLAQKAFARTAVYDAAISTWMADAIGESAPKYRAFGGTLIEALRYGENPHQSAAFYAGAEARPGVALPPDRSRARRSRTTTSTTRMPRSSSSPSSLRRKGRRWRSSSMPILAARRGARACVAAYEAALRCDPGVGLRRHRLAEWEARRRGGARDRQNLYRGDRRAGSRRGGHRHRRPQAEPAPASHRRAAGAARRRA